MAMADTVSELELPPPPKRLCLLQEELEADEQGEGQEKNHTEPSKNKQQLEAAECKENENKPQSSTEQQPENKAQLDICKSETLSGNFAKRKKVILLLSYCGQGYMGMQK